MLLRNAPKIEKGHNVHKATFDFFFFFFFFFALLSACLFDKPEGLCC